MTVIYQNPEPIHNPEEYSLPDISDWYAVCAGVYADKTVRAYNPALRFLHIISIFRKWKKRIFFLLQIVFIRNALCSRMNGIVPFLYEI